MFISKKPTNKIFGVRYFFKERRFPWSPYLKYKVHKYPAPVEDESASAEYPEILDLSPKSRDSRLRREYYDKIKALNTVEEKLLALNLPKYYGWPSFHLRESQIPYDYLPLAQYITRTVISEENSLPLRLSIEQVRPLIDQLKVELEKVIVFEQYSKKYRHDIETKFVEEEKQQYLSPMDISVIKTRDLVKQMNSAITRVLVTQYPHLFSLQVDYDPRIEAFWRVGGFYLSKEDRKLREAKKIHNSLMDLPIDRFFQYFGSPILQLRSKLPLQVLPPLNWQIPKEVADESGPIDKTLLSESADNDTGEKTYEISGRAENSLIYPLQSYRYRPDIYLQVPRERIHGAVIPGFWPNDPYRFGVLSYHSCNHITDRPQNWGVEEHKEALHAQALIASFAFCYGKACYQGFSTYYDITYPFVSQSILTDGQRFSFYQFQLNTTVLHSDSNENTNPLFNVCYATPAQELYHSVENDKIAGWNEEALLNLFALYTNAPEARESIDLCPYLNKEEKLVSQIADKKKRIFIHDNHRYLAAHRLTDRQHSAEIYDWERIFKIDHQIRVTDARKRHFEKFEDWINDRKLNERYPRYIPKKLREPGRAKMDKFEDIYYPNVYPSYHEIV